MQTVSRLYDNYGDAVAVVTELEAADVNPNRLISLIANEHARGRDTTVETQHTETSSGAGAGAGIGAALGGTIGLLTGIGVMAIPGIGPLVAAGWLATTLAGAATGAAAGGLIGALTGAGVSHEEAEVYEEGVRRGATLVVVRAEEADIPRIEMILDHKPSRPWRAHREEFVANGWTPAR